MTPQAASVREKFIALGRALSGFGPDDYRFGDKTLFHDRFASVNELAACELDEVEVDLLARDSDLAEAFERIDVLRSVYGPRLEEERARGILQAEDPWRELEGFLFYPNYLELARMETEGAGLVPGDRVVFLGSGPLPLSCITMCARRGLQCVGVEREARYVDVSRRVVERLGLSDGVEIIHGDHGAFPLPAPADLVMAASAAEPKDAVFAALAEALPKGAGVSFRTHEKGLRRLINRDNPSQAPSGFRELRRIQPRPPVINTCVFLERI